MKKKNCIPDDSDDFDDDLFVRTRSGRLAGSWRCSYYIASSRKR